MGQPGKSSAAHSWHPPQTDGSLTTKHHQGPRQRDRVSRIVSGVSHTGTPFTMLFCVVLAGLPNKSLLKLTVCPHPAILVSGLTGAMLTHQRVRPLRAGSICHGTLSLSN